MTKPAKHYEELDAITARLAEIEKEREPLRQRAGELVVALLKAKEAPTTVANRSPFSAAHVRTLARVAGLPPARRGSRQDPTN